MKRVLSLLVAVAMVLVMVPAVFADDTLTGTLEIESYGYTSWTAPATGTVKMEINVPGTYVEVWEGWDVIASFTDSGEVDVVEGTTYDICPEQCPTDSVVIWTYVGEGGNEDGDEGGEAEPVELALGDNTELGLGSYTYTAAEDGVLTVSVTSLYALEAGEWNEKDVTMMGRFFSLYLNDDINFTLTIQKEVTAGETVSILFVSEYYNADEVKATISLTVGEGGETGGDGDETGDDSGDEGFTTVSLTTEYDEQTQQAYPEFHSETVLTTEPGTITITISGDPGYCFWLYYPDGSCSVQKSGTERQTYTFDAAEAGEYTVKMASYADWNYASGTVTYKIEFTASEIVSGKPAYVIKDDVITKPGTYDVSMEYADVTIVTVSPAETGVYKFTVNGDAVIGNYGGGSWYIFSSENVEHATSIEWTCTEAPHDTETTILDENFEWITITQHEDGQSLMLGIMPASEDVESVQIIVEKIADYDSTEIPVVKYENKAELSQFEIPEGAAIGDYVNVYDEQTHTAVLGGDGYYHLDSADGPILLVDMDYVFALTEYLSSPRPVMQFYGTDEDGNTVLYDIAEACLAYEEVCDENGYYPLTEDLIVFYKDFGESHGVSSWVLGDKPGWNEDSAWMWACLTMTVPVEESPSTGDSFNVALVSVIFLSSCMGLVALTVSKKKFF